MEVLNSNNFDEVIKKGNVVADFFGQGCINCKMIEPFLIALETENPNVKFVKIDADAHGELAGKHGVTALPTLLFIKDGGVKQTLVGLKPKGVLARTIAESF